MKLNVYGALIAAFALICAPALADDYQVRDANGVPKTFSAKQVGSILTPRHVLQGMNGSTPIDLTADSSGRLSVNGGGTAGSPNAGVVTVQGIASGTNINVVCTSGCSGGTQYAEDIPHVSGNLGTMSLGVRSDTAASLAGTTGDYMPMIFDASGRLWVNCGSGCSGGAQFAEDAASTSGDLGTVAMAIRKPTPGNTSSADGDYESLQVYGGRLWVSAILDSQLPIGTNVIGKVGIDQTTPGTTNGVQDASTGSTGATIPSKATYSGAISGGNLTGIIQADASAIINMSTATTTQIVALSSGKKIYLTGWNVIAGGTGNLKLVYGTGTNCGTGTTDLTGNYNLSAQAGLVYGGSLGPVLIVPASNALCVTTSAAVQMSGNVSYTQF